MSAMRKAFACCRGRGGKLIASAALRSSEGATIVLFPLSPPGRGLRNAPAWWGTNAVCLLPALVGAQRCLKGFSLPSSRVPDPHVEG